MALLTSVQQVLRVFRLAGSKQVRGGQRGRWDGSVNEGRAGNTPFLPGP